jgi:hypothetical protein
MGSQLNFQSDKTTKMYSCITVGTADEASKTVTNDGNSFKPCQTAPGLMLQCLLGSVYKVGFVDFLSSVQIAWTVIFFLNIFVNKSDLISET